MKGHRVLLVTPNRPLHILLDRNLSDFGDLSKSRAFVHTSYLGQVLRRPCHIEPTIKRYGIDKLTVWVDMPLPETVGRIDMEERKVIADETVREVFLRKCRARAIPEFLLHTKDRQKDIVRDVMRELGAGPRQMVRVCGLTYAVVFKMWKNL